VQYTDIVLSDSKIDFTKKDIADNTLDQAGDYSYEAEYTLDVKDLAKYTDGVFVNDAQLTYSYSSDYGTGEYSDTASASVSCKIGGIVSYVWDSTTPAGITKDTANYPLPDSENVNYEETFQVKAYTGSETYEVYENGVLTGVWVFKGWQYGSTIYNGGESMTMPLNQSVKFVGIWEYKTTHSVTYSWTNAPDDVTLPTEAGRYYADQTYTVDATYTASTTVEDDSYIYTFSGWSNGGTAVSGTQTMGTSDVTLTGTWTKTTKYTRLTIAKNVSGSVADSQTFLFHITGENVDLTVSIHGAGSITIDGLVAGKTYTVTEETNWAWRYRLTGWTFSNGTTTRGSDSASVTPVYKATNELTFTNKKTNDKWLDGNSYNTNIFGVGSTSSSN
jgi:hypothetical protein